MGALELNVALGVLGLVSVLVGWQLRRAALVSSPPALDLGDPCLLALAAGGQARAVQAAIVYLRALGMLRSGGEPFVWVRVAGIDATAVRPVIAAHGDPAPDAGLLPVAVFEAIADEPSTMHLLAHPTVVEALRTLQSQAQDTGVLPAAARLRRVRRAAWPPAGVAVLALLTVLTQRLNGDPTDSMTKAITIAATLGAGFLFFRPVTVLPAATQVLDQLTRQFDVPAISPTTSPGASLREQALPAAGALALLGGGFEIWAAALFDQPELGRLATYPDLDITPDSFAGPAAGF